MASVSSSDITIVVPTRDRPTTTFETLHYLRNELEWDNHVIVVEQSTDRGAKLKSLLEGAKFDGIEYFYQEERGTGIGRNTGARHVQTDWIFFLDDDVRPNRAYLQTVAAFLTQNPWVDVVQPAVRPLGDWNAYTDDPEAWLRDYFANERERQLNPSDWDGVRWFQTRIPSPYDTPAIGLGTAFVISRRAFFGVGGFDQRLVGLGDDRELAIRLWWYGYRIHQLPQAIGFHLREAEGGTRTRSKNPPPPLVTRLTRPNPDPGLIYVYLKWFPGYPTYSYYGYQLLPSLRRPWVLPVKLFQLFRGIRQAKSLFRAGPLYINNQPPLSRNQVMPDMS